MNIEKELAKRLMDEGESGNRQVAYNHEISFYELVASGNLHRLDEALKTIGSTQTLGVLSPDKLRNVKYHTVILTALVSRFCIEAGLEISVAYNLSDIYIELIDAANTVDEVYVAENEYYDEVGPQAYALLQEYYMAMLESPFRLQLEEKPLAGRVAVGIHRKLS